jgi:thiopurine S-methyltransferase
MQHDFWHQRWQENQIGFHSPDINPYLLGYWSTLGIAVGSRVLLPLCGKSRDMLWLLAQGYKVVGVELSPMAVDTFFAENDMHPTVRRQGDFLVHQVDGLEIFCGDFFQLSTTELGKVDAVFDRAALVALPPEMRIDYVTHLSKLLESTQQILLVSFAYPQQEMPGPPFSVPGEDIEMLYQHWCTVELLTSEDVLQKELHFRERGLGSLYEQVYRMVVR